jgi:aarF domain-containing kinase
MLEASRNELKQRVPKALENSKKIRRSIYMIIDTYVIEPLCTGLRFLHLVVIFVPVIVTIPVIWFGGRNPEKDNERSGTIWWYGFLVRSMESAGAAFIKLGQWAASRTDIFPNQLCNIMSSLHSNAPAHSLAKTREIVQKAFDGRLFEDIFDEFDERPLGVGAIAQVYKAKLKPDLAVPGDVDVQEQPNLAQRFRKNVDAALKSTPSRVPSSYVAVKVLHPKIEKIVRRDLKIMAFFAAIINAIPTMEWLSFPDEVKQFGEMMRLQLDLRIEAANLTIFRQYFKDRTTAWFPYPYTDYTTREVLVEEFATGIPLEDFLINGGGVFHKEIADEGLDAFLHMVLIDNFIHADLHPGNIMVRFYKPEQPEIPQFQLRRSKDVKKKLENSTDVTEEVLERLRPFKHRPEEWQAQLKQIDSEGYRPQLIFIDTGLVTELNAVNRRNFLDLFKAVAEFDGYKAGHLMVERCRQPDAVINKEVFALKMQHLVLGVKSRTFALGNIKVGDILNEVLSMVRAHHVRLEGDFVNVVLSILLLEGIGRSLDPELDLFAG